MTDIGHAAADEDFVDLAACNIAERFHIVRVVRAGDDRLVDACQVNLNDRSIFSICIAFEQLRVGQPCLHSSDAALDGAHI